MTNSPSHNLSHASPELHITGGVTTKEFSTQTAAAKTREKLPGNQHCVKGKCQLSLYGLQVWPCWDLLWVCICVCVGVAVFARDLVCEVRAHTIHPQHNGE